MNLRRMNRVLEIDPELGYAVVEPGVRWTDLYEAITEKGYPLMLSIPDLGWGSVIGNALDHGITYMPYGADFQTLCGLEVVTADGELLRTGMGAMPDNSSWHLYRRGLGPTLDQLFMQSNFGVVVKAGVWLMPWPETLRAGVAHRLEGRGPDPDHRHGPPSAPRPDARGHPAPVQHHRLCVADGGAQPLV